MENFVGVRDLTSDAPTVYHVVFAVVNTKKAPIALFFYLKNVRFLLGEILFN